MARGVAVKEKDGRMILRCPVWTTGGDIIDTETPRGERNSGESHALSLGHVESGGTDGLSKGRSPSLCLGSSYTGILLSSLFHRDAGLPGPRP